MSACTERKGQSESGYNLVQWQWQGWKLFLHVYMKHMNNIKWEHHNGTLILVIMKLTKYKHVLLEHMWLT